MYTIASLHSFPAITLPLVPEKSTHQKYIDLHHSLPIMEDLCSFPLLLSQKMAYNCIMMPEEGDI